MSQEDDMSIDELIDNLYSVRRKAKKYEDRANELKERILKWMDESDKTKYRSGSFVIDRKQMSKETVSKASLPPEIWEKYSKRTTFYTLNVKYTDDDIDIKEKKHSK